MKSKLTSVVLSILLHLGLAGALVYAYSQKPDVVAPAQTISVMLVAVPQQQDETPAPEPVEEPKKEMAAALPTPAPKKATPKTVAKVEAAKPKASSSKGGEKKILATKNKQAPVRKAQKKPRSSEEEKWAELLKPVKKPPSQAIRAGMPVTRTKQPTVASRNATPSSTVARAATKAVPQQVQAQVKSTKPSSKQASANYKAQLRRLIEQHKRYPSRAKRRGDEGVVVIAFTVSASGQVTNVRVKTSSGSRALDSAAMNTVQKVSGRLPFSSEMSQRQLSFNVPLTYRLR